MTLTTEQFQRICDAASEPITPGEKGTHDDALYGSNGPIVTVSQEALSKIIPGLPDPTKDMAAYHNELIKLFGWHNEEEGLLKALGHGATNYRVELDQGGLKSKLSV